MLYLLHVLNWDLSPGMLEGENSSVSPDGIGPVHVASDVKGAGKGLLQCHYVLDCRYGTRDSHLGQLCLDGGFEGNDSLGGVMVYKG